MQAAELRRLGIMELLDETVPAVEGSLSGVRLVVKDLFDVAGLRTGAGNPTWLATHTPAREDAAVVALLRAAGARLVATTITDELAFSLFGSNHHYGTPENPHDPQRLPGGSSAGSGVAVAQGFADLGLGTDTAGSIRVPASWLGLWGVRTSHGLAPMQGVVPLAPSFDTIGVLAREGGLLAAALGVLGVADARPVRELVVASDLVELVAEEERRALLGAAHAVADVLGVPLVSERALDGVELASLARWFRARQLWEAWQAHGAWIEGAQPDFGPGVAARFRAARQAPPVDAAGYAGAVASLWVAMSAMIAPGCLLVVPVTPSVAPKRDQSLSEAVEVRERMLALNCIAGLLGACELVVPTQLDGLPIGLGLIAAPGADATLGSVAATLSSAGWGAR